MKTQTCNRNGGPKAAQCCSGLERFLSPEFFKALCDPSRLAILGRLASTREAQNVSGVGECCTIDLSVVSRHLKVLKDAGIITSVKRGKEVFYSIDYGTVITTLRDMADAIEQCCPPEKTKGAKK